jgi:hypothetical protein
MSPPEKGTAPLGRRAEADTRTNQQPEAYPSPGQSTEMRILGGRTRWLDAHEHWWLRQLRWHRERNGPECACRSCTWEPEVAA